MYRYFIILFQISHQSYLETSFHYVVMNHTKPIIFWSTYIIQDIDITYQSAWKIQSRVSQ